MAATARMLLSATLALAVLAPPAAATPGARDTAIGGGDGTALAPPGNAAELGSIALHGDRIVMAGNARTDDEDCAGTDHALVRLLADGTRDPAFASGGVAVNPFAPCDPLGPRSMAPPAALTL